MVGSSPEKANSLLGLPNLLIFPISEMIILPKVEAIPGIVVIGLLVASNIDLISTSITFISWLKTSISLIVCWSSKDNALLELPIDFLASSMISEALPLEYLPLEVDFKILVISSMLALANSLIFG